MLFLQVYSFFLAAAFSLALVVLFLLLTSFTVCHAILDCLSSTESLILLIWFWMYSAYSFGFTLVSSFCAFLSFWVLILVGFRLLHKGAICKSARFFLTANVSHRTICLALCLVIIHHTTSSVLALMKFSYSSFRVTVSDISWWPWNFLPLCFELENYLVS